VHFIIAFVLALIIAFSYGVASNNVQVSSIDHWNGVAQTPAQAAGLQPGDTIVSVNGHRLSSPNTFTNAVHDSKGRPVSFTYLRDGQTHAATVTPRLGQGISVAGGIKLNPHDDYIGVVLTGATQSVNPLSAVKVAADNLGSATREEVDGVIKTFSPSGLRSVVHQVTNSKAATQAADNPDTATRPVSLVGIAGLGVQAQKAGLEDLLELLILINIIFGLLNMLPMLPLDGGHVAVAAYEWIRTKKGQAYYRADITKLFPVVFVFLAFLSIFVLSGVFLDLTHPVKNVFP
jgi:membrane-associated protease RseP (regulator of RpoE activity)